VSARSGERPRLVTRLRSRSRKQSGFVIVFVAFNLTLLLILAAICVDLGNAYWSAQKLQKAADAGALSGAVKLPDDVSGAQDLAEELVQDNGYDDVTAGQGDRPTQLEVTVTDEVPTYFAGIIGIDSLTVTRRAVAEYDQPVAMGSPSNRFGNQPECGGCTSPQFWVDINGPGSGKRQGNAYTTTVCDGADNCSGTNADYKSDGYYWVVKNRAPGSSLTIRAFDIAYVNVGDNCNGTEGAELATVFSMSGNDPRYASGPSSPFCTGDSSHGANPEQTVTTHWRVLQPDATPWDNSDNPVQPGCSGSVVGATSALAAWNDLTLRNSFFRKWYTICTISGAQDGSYLLNIWSTAGKGANRYSLQATTASGTQPLLYADGYMTLYANAPAANATFHLARVFPGASGRRLLLKFYDMGDAAAAGTITVLPPAEYGGSFSGCQYTPPPGFSTPDSEGLWGSLQSTGSGCSVSGISSANWNGQWSSWRIPIPDDYTCNFNDPTGCWVRINFQFPSGTQDTTSWEASLEGNPVHLVE
jgi:Flp pilus assembly protein TadG